jgi:hypothetical protein
VKPRLRIAFPALSSPSGSSIDALTERVSDLAVRASAPSIVATATTAASEKLSARSASTPKAAASAAYSAGSTKRGGGRSSRVTTTGVSSAGTNPVPMNSNVVAKALSVCSKTRTERATIPSQSPSSLTA